MEKAAEFIKKLAVTYFTKGGWKQKLFGILVGTVSLFLVGYGAWVLFRKGDKLAKARHRLAALEAEKQRTQAKKKVEKNDKKASKLDKKIDSLQDEIRDLEEEVLEEKREYDRTKNNIDSISDWRSLNEYVESSTGR